MSPVEEVWPHRIRPRASIAGPFQATVVHRLSTRQKPWKTRHPIGGNEGFPHLWRVVWSGRKALQIAYIDTVGHGTKSSLRAAPDAAMLAHPETLTRSVQTSVERQIELTADSLWTDVAARLREALNDTTFQTWFGEVSGAEIDGDAFAVAVPNDFTREWIEGHFLDLMRAAVRDSGGGDLRVQLRVAELPAPVAVTSIPSAVTTLHMDV